MTDKELIEKLGGSNDRLIARNAKLLGALIDVANNAARGILSVSLNKNYTIITKDHTIEIKARND